MEPLFADGQLRVLRQRRVLGHHEHPGLEQVVHELFVARRAPAYWRDFWLATDVRDGHPAAVGAEVATVDECFEAILAERGAAFTQASTKRFYGRPGLAFVPVRDLPPSTLSVAWRKDAAGPLVHDFVKTARVLVLHPVSPSGVPSRRWDR